MNILRETFLELLAKHRVAQVVGVEFWGEIEKFYSNKDRHYHTLHHLYNLLQQLKRVQPQINNWDVVLFSLYYHDIIYNSLKSDNEERSAMLAARRLKQISIHTEIIENCKRMILATKNHIENDDIDINYFTDADLSILGQDWDTYLEYYKNVRKEYFLYPTLVYNTGRKKVLNHFLLMKRIFKTDYFFNKFEERARQNLQKELYEL